jgi:uncharacterized small protein (TIGR04563 family)
MVSSLVISVCVPSPNAHATRTPRRRAGVTEPSLFLARRDAMAGSWVYAHPMNGTDKRKQSLYFPEAMLKEITDEATRQDRSISWIVQQAWKTARKAIFSSPATPGSDDAHSEAPRSPT